MKKGDVKEALDKVANALYYVSFVIAFGLATAVIATVVGLVSILFDSL